jgi:hypothetical protein
MQLLRSFADWLPFLAVGLSFTVVGLLKVYGLSRGIVGGGGRPASTRICGSCPSWSRRTNVAMACLFLIIGWGYLAYFAWTVFGRSVP